MGQSKGGAGSTTSSLFPSKKLMSEKIEMPNNTPVFQKFTKNSDVSSTLITNFPNTYKRINAVISNNRSIMIALIYLLLKGFLWNFKTNKIVDDIPKGYSNDIQLLYDQAKKSLSENYSVAKAFFNKMFSNNAHFDGNLD